jgi:hypothetical protein
MARRLRLATVAALVLAALPACSNNTPTVPGGVLRAQITLSVTPSPLTPISSTPPLYSLRYIVKISEVAGLGGDLQFVNGTVFDDTSGLTVGINNYDSSDILVFVGSQRIEAKGSRDVQQQIDYVLPAGSTKAILTVNVQFKDDRGSFVSQSILVRIS